MTAGERAGGREREGQRDVQRGVGERGREVKRGREGEVGRERETDYFVE